MTISTNGRWTCAWMAAAILWSGCSNDAAAPANDVAIGATAGAPARTGGPQEAVREVTDPLQEYRSQCSAAGRWSLDCEYLRGLLVGKTVLALETIERSRDRRGAPLAMKALAVLDAPTILIAAGRVLGQFPDTPGLADKVYPLFDSPYLEVQRIGADLLGRLANAAVSPMANQWSANHSGVPVMGPYDELEFPEHYEGMGFPEYPGAERYTPADSDRSIAWWTTDPPATVTSRLAETTRVQPIGYQEWAARSQEQQMKLAQAMMDPQKMAEVQKLTEQYMKTQDAKIMERVQKLQAEMTASIEKAAADSEKAMDRVANPSGSTRVEEIYYLVAEERDGHVARLVMIYPELAVNRTVIQMSWNLGDYPPAWGDWGDVN